MNIGNFNVLHSEMTGIPTLQAGTVTKNQGKGNFENFLLDAMNSMNSQQMSVTSLSQQVITDPDSVDVHDVTIAMAKANLSLSLTQSVVDRLIRGWNEVTTAR